MKRRYAALVSCLVMTAAAGGTAFAQPYLSDTSVTLGVGDTAGVRLMDCTGKTVWETSNKAVFHYEDGIVTALGEGTATLTARNGGKSYVCTVTVSGQSKGTSNADAWSDRVSADHTIQPGEDVTLWADVGGSGVMVRSDNAASLSIKLGSMNDGVIPVTVTGLSAGVGHVYVYSDDEVVESFTVLVTSDGTAADVQSTASTPQLQVLDLINAEREAQGLEPYVYDDEIAECAKIRAEELTVKFSHTRPDGTKGVDIITGGTGTVGENLGRGFKSARSVYNAWMRSKGHRANILSDKFTRIGVGYNKKGNCWVLLLSD
ncbi:MAG: CAP domain-containing protein [Oscillospiraceae bacterium]|nr:CAP domain-containing protein [Oscillospiraceae bacterium]